MFNLILRKQFLIYIFAAFKGDKRQFKVFYYGFEAVATDCPIALHRNQIQEEVQFSFSKPRNSIRKF